jgi:hypothetical protein
LGGTAQTKKGGDAIPPWRMNEMQGWIGTFRSLRHKNGVMFYGIVVVLIRELREHFNETCHAQVALILELELLSTDCWI